MEKVILTKKQAEVFEKWKKENREPHVLVRNHAQYPNDWAWKPINGMLLDTFIKAAYGFYEVRKTPEERLRAYVDDELILEKTLRRTAFLDGIYFTLEILEIKIEGVNVDNDSE